MTLPAGDIHRQPTGGGDMDFVIKDIPESQKKGLAKSISSSLSSFYADPENRRKFEEWKKEKERRQHGGGK